MGAQVELPGVGKAATCEAAAYHRPKPLRFVWHHVLPEACGGKTERNNLVALCDSCHYSAHMLLWLLANGGIPPGTGGTRKQYALAMRGYRAATAAGTTGKIPKEA